jgi:hypothetical protein
MEKEGLFLAVFLSSLLLTLTAYSIYIGFGPSSTVLKDPFEDS